MSTVTLSIPDETAEALRVAPEAVGDELRILAAMKLFEMGRLSSGKAAALAGIPRTVFLMKLGEYGVDAFDLSLEDLEKEARLGPSDL
ncbi:MAG: UPF0175 family protein [Candidatus Hydrogenedentes bacterium]|nr:UPF0175 family protein [Candidatus Hydrogenedentota bacterium]